jgi:hypothetical protein
MAQRLSESERQTGQAAGFGGTLPAIVAENFKRLDKNTLIGSADLTVVRWKLTFRRCLWFCKGSKEWINFPGREWIDRNGLTQYADLIKFTDRDTHDRFQQAALAAIHAVAGEVER